MAYTPLPYTTSATVSRILRTSNDKVRIGTGKGEITVADVDEYILDASRFIDGYIRAVVLFDKVPIPSPDDKMEIGFAASRLTAFYIYSDMYSSFRGDSLGPAVQGWEAEAFANLERFKEHVNLGVYSDISPATSGIRFVTSEQFFQTRIGVRHVREQKRDIIDKVPIKEGNIDPYHNGDLNG